MPHTTCFSPVFSSYQSQTVFLHSIRRTASQLCTNSICGTYTNNYTWHITYTDSWFVYFCSRCVKWATSPFTWLWISSGEMVSRWALLTFMDEAGSPINSNTVKWNYTYVIRSLDELSLQDPRVEDFLCQIRTPSPGFSSLYPAQTTHTR